MTTECAMKHETSTITRIGWTQTYDPVMCAHFDGQSCIAHIREGNETVMTVYRDGLPGSLTFPLEEPIRESFERECAYYLRGEAQHD
jgi:hypothetical protein